MVEEKKDERVNWLSLELIEVKKKNNIPTKIPKKKKKNNFLNLI